MGEISGIQEEEENEREREEGRRGRGGETPNNIYIMAGEQRVLQTRNFSCMVDGM